DLVFPFDPCGHASVGSCFALVDALAAKSLQLAGAVHKAPRTRLRLYNAVIISRGGTPKSHHKLIAVFHRRDVIAGVTAFYSVGFRKHRVFPGFGLNASYFNWLRPRALDFHHHKGMSRPISYGNRAL